MAGKFISPDPLGYLGGYNLYAYASNNPLQYHDPEGEFAHIIVGSATGAGFGAGFYLARVWWSDEEFDWIKFAIYTGAGAASGAASAATFGAASGLLGTGFWADLGAGALAGAFGCGTHGVLSSGGVTLVVSGDLSLAGKAALKGGLLGVAVGAVGGGLGGAALGQLSRKPWLEFITNKTLRGLAATTGTGAVAGGGVGAVGGGYAGYQERGWAGVLPGAARGAGRGTVAGAMVGAVGFGIGKALDVVTGASWVKTRSEYWKGEARNNPEAYSRENVARMKQGRAPQQMNPMTGKPEPMHLHHRTLFQKSGLPRSLTDQKWNLQKVWPAEHQTIHFP